MNLEISFLKFVEASKHRQDENAKLVLLAKSFDKKISAFFVAAVMPASLSELRLPAGFLVSL